MQVAFVTVSYTVPLVMVYLVTNSMLQNLQEWHSMLTVAIIGHQ